jgi:PAS domain-containing protein
VQKPLELILMRQLTGYLAMPILIADAEGTLLFYNRPAEAIIGRSFAETGELPLLDYMREVHLYDEDGFLIPPEERPLPVAMREHRATHRRLRIQGLDGRMRLVESTVLPLQGQGGRTLGGAVIFWELDQR